MKSPDSVRGGGECVGGENESRVGVGDIRAVGLAALVASSIVLVGCSGVLPGGGDEDWTAGSEDVPDAVESNLSTPPEEIYERVETMLGMNGTHLPITVHDRFRPRDVSTPFLRHVVGEQYEPADRDARDAGYNYLDGTVMVNEDSLGSVDDETVEVAIAREFARATLVEHRWNGSIFVVPAVRYVASHYAAEYTNVTVERIPPSYADDVSGMAWAHLGAHEYHASKWIDERADSPADLRELRGELPDTTEQLLHGTDDPRKEFALNLTLGNVWIEPSDRRFAAKGEVGTRAVLRTHLDRSTAVEAADGWGGDRIVATEASLNETVGVVWAHRWDGASDADEFADAMDAYLDARREETDETAFEFRRTGPEETLLIASQGNFTRNADVALEDGNLTVAVGA